jgi:spore germination protein GerM
VQGDSIFVNVSDAFQKACEGLSVDEERNMVYCMVNTLTEIDAIDRVCFYVNGKQKPLAGGLSMAGEFFRHPGIIR